MKKNLIIVGVIALIFGLSIFLSYRQAAFQQKRTEIRARHILVMVDRSDPVKQAQALEKIKEIRERLVAGENFAALAKQYSEDALSAPIGGDLGFMELDDLDESPQCRQVQRGVTAPVGHNPVTTVLQEQLYGG